MTEKQFRDSPEERQRLTELLQNSTLQRALQIVEDKAKVRGIVDPRQHAPLDTLVSHRYHRLQGIQHAVDTLRKLTEPNDILPESEKMPEQLKSLIDAPYFSTLPVEMQKAAITNKCRELGIDEPK